MDRRGFLYSLTALGAFSGNLWSAQETEASSCLEDGEQRKWCLAGVQFLSDIRYDSIHSYFDICPESLDGKRYLYFAFSKDIPGRGNILIGQYGVKGGRIVARNVFGSAHDAALQQWVSEKDLAFVDVDRHGAVVTKVVNDQGALLNILRGGLRSVDLKRRRGLFSTHELRRGRENIQRESVRIVELDTANEVGLLELDGITALRSKISGDGLSWRVKHTKWSPNGEQFLFVAYPTNVPEASSLRPLLFVADSSGGGVQLVSDSFHHPTWGTEGDHIWWFEGRGGRDQVLIAFDVKKGIVQRRVRGVLGDHGVVHFFGDMVVTDKVSREKDREGRIFLCNMNGQCVKLFGFEGRKLTYRQRLHSHPVWSRNGNAILANVFRGASRCLVRLKLWKRH